MELSELQNIWKEYDKKLSENTRLNKEILRHILLHRPQKRINRLKIIAAIRILSPAIIIFLILILNVQFYISLRFYIGLALFMPVYFLSYSWDIKYFSLLGNVDFTMPVLSIKRIIAELEKYKIKTTKIRYMLMPVAMTGFLLMIIHKITFSLDFLSILPLLLIVLVFFSSVYLTFKYSINERYKKLNKDLDETDRLSGE